MSGLLHLCRDCLESFDAPTRLERCRECGSSRLLAHEELDSLEIAHVDCDAFFASVEKRDRPELVDRPVIIGGGQRGVVSTCCYIARMSGVRSAMPMITALRKCPDAVVIKPDMAKYVEASKLVKTRMQELTPLVEPLSIDEAFLDMSGTSNLHKSFAAKTLARFAKQVSEEIGITVSVGLSHNKFLAKVASDLEKPRGFALIGKAETVSFLAPKPISIIYGVGQVMAERLRKDGLLTIGQLQKQDPEELMRRYGETGARLARLSRGEDQRHLTPSRGAKSVSSETTFMEDISDFERLSQKLLRQCERVADRMKKSNLVADTVTLKLKTSGFQIRTRARHLPVPTQLSHVMYENAAQLLERELDGTHFRLLGIGMSHFFPADGSDPSDLLEPQIARKAAAERAMDKVRTRFGSDAVVRGKLYRQESRDTSVDPSSEESE